MTMGSGARARLRRALVARAEVLAALEEEADAAMARAGAMLDEAREGLAGDGCEVRVFTPDSSGDPLGAVREGWCAVIPGTCVYLAVWTPDPDFSGADSSALSAPFMGRVLEVPHSVETVSRRFHTSIGVFAAKTVLEAWDWRLAVDAPASRIAWEAAPASCWRAASVGVSALEALDTELDRLVGRMGRGVRAAGFRVRLSSVRCP